jgi:hypothetical protein
MPFCGSILAAPLRSFGAATLLACLPALISAAPPHDKSVWNYDGGIVFISDGSFSTGPCFRISGRVTAPGFFDNLKRVDRVDADTVFRRGDAVLTEFPDELTVAFIVHDHPCTIELEKASEPPIYLTRAMMSSLRLSFYWKRGVDLRPVRGIQPRYFSVDPVLPTAAARARNLPEKLEWSYEFSVPSAGVPLTDSLVLILRTPDGTMAARVAARM